jgi:hypothetical protein
VILACWNLPRATALGADAYRDPDAKAPAPSVTMAIRAPLQAILPIDTRSATGELTFRDRRGLLPGPPGAGQATRIQAVRTTDGHASTRS